MKLDATTALITGAAHRVGRAIAIELADAGCNIVVHFNESEGPAQALVEEIRRRVPHSSRSDGWGTDPSVPHPSPKRGRTGHRRCHPIQADLADPANWQRIISEAVGAMGSLAVLVNNASIFQRMTLDGFDVGEWERTFRVNLTAVAGLCHHAAPHLRRAGGKIINLTDISTRNPWSGHLAYCASKAGLVNLTRALARSLAPDVQVNAVSPGIAVFPDHYDEQTRDRLVAKVPLKRPGTPEDVAKAVRFLCADADYVTGQIINVDGGSSIA